MKKLALLMIFMLATACAADDDVGAPLPAPTPPVEAFLKATVNGTSRTFSKVVVETVTVSNGSSSYVDLHVTASNNGDSANEVSFKFEQFVTGTETCYYFYDMLNGTEYDTEFTPSLFTTDITENSAGHVIRGTFSGTLKSFDGTQSIEVTNGSFQAAY